MMERKPVHTSDQQQNSGKDIAKNHKFLGLIYAKQGLNQQAAEQFEAYLKCVPTDENANYIKKIIQQLRVS